VKTFVITKIIQRLPFGPTLLDALDVFHATPAQIGAGAALGLFVALAPPDAGLAWLALFLAGMTSANLTATFTVGLAVKPLSIFWLDPIAWDVGRRVNEGTLAPVLSKILALPVVSLLGLERYHVMGAATVSILAAVPIFLIVRTLSSVFQRGTYKAIEVAKDKLRRGEKLTDEERDLAERPEPAKIPVRYKLILLFAIALAIVDLVAFKPILSAALQRKLPVAVGSALGTPPVKVEWKSLDASLVRGTVAFEDLRVADPQNPDEDLVRAKTARAKWSTAALLLHRLSIDELVLEEPKMHVKRDASGRLSIEPDAGKPAAAPTSGDSSWAWTIKRVLEEAKRRRDEELARRKAPDSKSDDKKDDKSKTDASKPDVSKTPDVNAPGGAASDRPTTPPPTETGDRAKHGIPGFNPDLASPPRVVVKKLLLGGLEVDAKDAQGGAPGFRFDEADLRELTDDRLANGQPAKATFKGAVIDAKKQQLGKVEAELVIEPPAERGKPSRFILKVSFADLDLATADPWIASFSALRFDKGKAKLALQVQGEGLDGPIQAAPRIELTELVAKARRPGEKVLGGLDAQKVADEVTAAGAFTLDDVKVTGTLTSPEIDAGDTLKKIVIEGGERWAKKKAGEEASKLADKAADKAKEKLGAQGGDAAKGLLDKGKSLFGGN
jgi:uncharacterized protein (TIGR03546 family)